MLPSWDQNESRKFALWTHKPPLHDSIFPVREGALRFSKVVDKGADRYRMKNNSAGSFIIS